MNLVRSLIFTLAQIVTVIPWALICLFFAPLPLKWRYKFTMRWLNICMFFSRWILGIKPNVIGKENIPAHSVVFLSKHQSSWETFFYPTMVDRELCYVFKREILFVPFFGWGIGLLNMIHIDRSKGVDSFENIIRQGTEKLAQNRSVIMFPEGTRFPSGKLGKYKSGGTRLAVRADADIVPIAVNSGRLWPKKPFTKKPGVVTVSFGPPISAKGREPMELMNEVQTWIETEMRRISPDDYT